MPLFLSNIDLNKNQLINAKIHVLASDPGSPQEGVIYYNSTDKTLKYYSGAAWVVLGRLDQVQAPTAAVSLNSQKITSLGTPTSADDAATKAYVDNIGAGLDPKASVRAATVVAGTLATSFEDGDTIDGVVLATGDRILIKDQADNTANGIYVVAASGAPTRASDANTGAELSGGAFVFVEEGSVNADTGWVASHDGTPTLGSDPITFTQFSSSASITAGDGLTKTGNTLDVGAGTGIAVGANDVALTGQALAFHNLGSNGLVTLTSAGNVSARTITGTANQIVVSNGDGVAGNPTLTTPQDIGTGSSVTFANVTVGTGGAIRTGTSDTNTLLIRAYDVDGTAYVTFITLTAGNTPTCDLSDSVTKGGGNYIYRAGGTDVPVADGGTGASTTAGARTNLGFVGKYTALVGDGVATTITITQATHGLAADGTNVAAVYDATTGAQVYPDVTVVPASGNVVLGFASAPASNAYRVCIMG